ncbi:TPA: hypothetical protein ACH3X1_011290 [Trebouxia sp. C0004]
MSAWHYCGNGSMRLQSPPLLMIKMKVRTFDLGEEHVRATRCHPVIEQLHAATAHLGCYDEVFALVRGLMHPDVSQLDVHAALASPFFLCAYGRRDEAVMLTGSDCEH